MNCYRCQRTLLVVAIITNITTVVYLAYLQDQILTSSPSSDSACSNLSSSLQTGNNRNSVSIIIREFEDFDNDIADGLLNLQSGFGEATKTFIVTDDQPYPPLSLKESTPTVKLIRLSTSIVSSYETTLLTNWLLSEYVLIIPDGVHLLSELKNPKSLILHVFNSHKNHSNVRIIAWPVGGANSVQCLGLNVKLKEWTIQYYTSSGLCDSLGGGAFVLGMKRSDFLQLASPLARPIQDSIFIQSTLRDWKVVTDKTPMWDSVKLFTDPHSAWKQKALHRERLKKLYAHFGIKLVHHVDGTEEYFGCSKITERCFGTIHNEMPAYLYKGQWTPPCCLKALRITSRHVFKILEKQNVRYWLEGGSLLGAARTGDIIPWDYDVDIGIYLEDIPKSTHLARVLQESFEDEDGFVWEKSAESEGDFIRVQYSESNRLHVDIFPFFPRNGTMTKNTWMPMHRQDMPFPEHFLKPLEKIPFVGIDVSVPNNRRKFIDLKFGEGAIDNPKYPDTSKVKYT